LGGLGGSGFWSSAPRPGWFRFLTRQHTRLRRRMMDKSLWSLWGCSTWSLWPCCMVVLLPPGTARWIRTGLGSILAAADRQHEASWLLQLGSILDCILDLAG
jgi:hypothetical protein